MLTLWFIVAGAVLVTMALGGVWVARSPVSPALLYLLLGLLLGGLTPLVDVRLPRDAAWMEVLAEVAVLISLFGIGLKLRIPATWAVWRAPVQMASVGMVVAIASTALAARVVLGLDWAAAVLLGAIVAPTDPVLASDVQVRDADERDALRITLSAEGGLNDGTAFPFVLLGLGLLGAHDLGSHGMLWAARDLVWAVGGALAIGWCFAVALSALLRRLRALRQPMAFEEFFVLGVIAIVYGSALAVDTYGFLAVFTAGLVLRHRETGAALRVRSDDPAASSAPLAPRLQHFTEQLERLAEVALVLLVGALVATSPPGLAAVLFALVMLLAVRPLSAVAGMWGVRVSRRHLAFVAWFGIRGIGSIYYLTYAIGHGAPGAAVQPLIDATLALIVASIVAHGLSATVMMRRRDGAAASSRTMRSEN